jgi:enediyne biosynthesis protein E4
MTCKNRYCVLIGLAMFFFLASCGSEEEKLFTLLDDKVTNIDFVNEVSETETFNIISYEYMYNGAGVAAGDFNNDGQTDLFFTGNQVPNRLYLNKGDWKFFDITRVARVDGRPGWRTGVALADVNGDKLLDIYVCYSGPGADADRINQLFINNGGEVPTFTDKAAEFNLDAPGTYSTQASFFDFDLDGDLDMFLLNHAKITYSPFYNTRKLRNLRHPQYGNRLYRNDNGKFADVSADAGIHGSGINFGLGVSVSDVNADGWPDIYVTNDYEEQDYFYLNNHDGTFRECLKEGFRHISRFGMGCDIADYNNDGMQDVFVVDMLPEDNYRAKLLKGGDEYDKYMLLRDSGYHHQNMRNMLQLNLGNNASGTPQFSEVGQLAGVAATDWSWCPLFTDFDNDGWKDLFVTNGYLRDYTNMDFLKYTFEEYKKTSGASDGRYDTLALIREMPSTQLANYCFRNRRDLGFDNMSEAWGVDAKAISNGAIAADLDNDGDQDLVVNNINSPAHIYRNEAQRDGKHYIRVSLKGTDKNPGAIGAKVFVRTDSLIQVQENFSTRGFQSSTIQPLNFGLGNDQTANSVLVQWPDNSFSRILNAKTDTTLVISQGTFSYDSIPGVKKETPLLSKASGLNVDYTHRENEFVDYKEQFLLPYQLSSNGPCLATADINKDGFDDFFVGGAAGQSGELFLTTAGGGFKKSNTAPWRDDAPAEDTGVVFFDAEGDGDQDLYVCSGGGEFNHEKAKWLQDRLYLNEKGNFTKSDRALPRETSNGSCVVATDYDKDGDQDLFVGGKVLPGYFPLPAYSLLLRNDSRSGEVKFTDVTPAALKKPAMINAVIWADVNSDSWPDLVLAGDFSSVLVSINSNGKLGQPTEIAPGSTGLWSSLFAIDIDQDGDLDFLAGNAGLNTQFKTSVTEPLAIYYHDFNEDSRLDPILTHYVKGKRAVYASRDELLEQLPHLKKRYVKYADFASSGLEGFLNEDQLKKAKLIEAATLESSVFVNDGGNAFRRVALPVEAQFSRINGFIEGDFNKDQKRDILLAGNFFPYRVQMGRSDAGSGLLLTTTAGGGFQTFTFKDTGFLAEGDIRSIVSLNLAGGTYVILGRNNDKLEFFKINNDAKSILAER